MIFVGPIFGGIDDEVAHLLEVGGRLVAASGGVGIFAVVPVAVVIAGSGELEVGAVVFSRVIIDHVHNHADSGLVESLDHLLHLADAGGGVGRVGGIASFGSVVVLRIITPVVGVELEVGLVD